MTIVLDKAERYKKEGLLYVEVLRQFCNGDYYEDEELQKELQKDWNVLQ